MNLKKSKIIATILSGVMLCSCFAGCSASSGSGSSKKTISINIMTSTLKLKKVTYYDFMEDEKIKNYTGTCYSASINSKDVVFIDAEGNARWAVTDKKLSSKPSTVKVYTNSSKSTSDTYKCKY